MMERSNKDLGFDPAEHDSNPLAVAYREALANGLELVLDDGAETLADIVRALNAQSIFGANGKSWTEESLESELARLAG